MVMKIEKACNLINNIMREVNKLQEEIFLESSELILNIAKTSK